MALTHHERIDGTGYPAGLAGDEIPLEGRITAIADVFDALTSDRVYRPAFQPDEARAMMPERAAPTSTPSCSTSSSARSTTLLEIRRSAGTMDAGRALGLALAHAHRGR